MISAAPGQAMVELCSAFPNLRDAGECFFGRFSGLVVDPVFWFILLIAIFVLIASRYVTRRSCSVSLGITIGFAYFALPILLYPRWIETDFSWSELLFNFAVQTIAIAFAITIIALASMVAFLVGAVIAALSRHGFATWRLWHWAVIKLIGFGHGSAMQVQFVVGVVITIVWILSGVTGFYQFVCQDNVCGSGYLFTVSLEIFYKLVGTLVPQQGISPLFSANGTDYPALVDLTLVLGTLLTLWVGLPQIIRVLIRALQKFIVRFAVSNHYVIVGLGQSGGHLLSNLVADNKTSWLPISLLPRPIREKLGWEEQRHHVVAALESSADIAQARGLVSEGTVILDGDGLDEQHYRDLAVQHAAGVHVATGIDVRNVDIAARIRQFCIKHGNGNLQTIVVPVVNDRVLLQRVNDEENFLGVKGADHARAPAIIEPFSTDQTAVRHLFRDRSIGFLSKLQPVERAHLVILGFGSVGEAVALKALQTCLYPGLKPPRLSIICNNAAQEAKFFAKRFPWLGPRVEAKVDGQPKKMSQYSSGDKACCELGIDIGFHDYDFTFIDKDITELVSEHAEEQSVTAIFICRSDRQDDQNLTAALAMQSVIDRTRAWLAPTFVRLSQDTGLIEALRPGETEIELADIIEAFGPDRTVCTKREIFERPQRALARNLHLAYRLFSTAAELGSKENMAGLTDLEEEFLNVALTDLPDNLTDAEERIESLLAREEGAWDEVRATVSNQFGSATLNELNAARDKVMDRLPRSPRKTRWERANVSWQKLASSFIRGNFTQAEHIPDKLYGLGYKPVQNTHSAHDVGLDNWPIESWQELQQKAFQPTDELANIGKDIWRVTAGELAKLEHTRFMVDRAIVGFVWGPQRDNLRKIHPSLVTWEQMSASNNEAGEIDKKKDFGHVLGLKLHLQAIEGSDLRIAQEKWYSERLVGFDGLKARSPSYQHMEDVPDNLPGDIEVMLQTAFANKGYKNNADTITLVSTANGIGDFIFLSCALKYLRKHNWRCQLLIARPLPFDIDMEDDSEALKPWQSYRTDILEQCHCIGDGNATEGRHARRNSWLVDLLKPGEQHTEFRGKDRTAKRNRQAQRQRAMDYIRARADVMITMVVNKNNQAKIR